MANIEKDLVFLLIQYLDEQKLEEIVHRLEAKTGCYFNMRYFKELVTQGNWDEMEKYLVGFIKIDANKESTNIFYHIRRQKYLEALDKPDRAKAVDIYIKDLKIFESCDKNAMEQICLLLTMDNLWQRGTELTRVELFGRIEKLIEANPLFRHKLVFPKIEPSRLRCLIGQSLKWQHQQCKNPRPGPVFKTLFENHVCFQPTAARAASPANIDKDILFLILQYLDEQKHEEIVHRLEAKSGCYFNKRYFKELVTQGNWDEMEKYLVGFIKIDANKESTNIFFHIRSQKYLEALDKCDRAKAVDIYLKDLKIFESCAKDVMKQMSLLLTMDNFRACPSYSRQPGTGRARVELFGTIEKLIEANPLFRRKLVFPKIEPSRLRCLIGQSLKWQHQQCKNPRPGPDFKTLFEDHACFQPTAARAASPAMIIPRMSAHGVTAAFNNPLKRSRPWETSQQVGNIPQVPYSGQPHGHHTLSPDDLPKVVATTLPQGSPVKSMDFHPIHQILLLVGTIGGDVFLWDVGARKKISETCFDISKLDACSKELQESLKADETVSANHVAWSPDGTLFGVAYSKNIVHIYSFRRDSGITSHLEIEAHIGSVNHLAFSHPNEQLYVVTCGDDKLIKVWDAATGARRFTLEGHEAPVFSVCPHQKEYNSVCPRQKEYNQFVFSAATDGKVKTWLYDELGARGTYDAPGHSSTRMAYISDGTRLFSCGTNKKGESFLVEWNDHTEGSIKRTYKGLGKQAAGIVQFDTTKNRFLAAGDESTIKIWDMDNTNLLTNIHADGGLPASPCVRFNREGILLAVSTSDKGVKILATDDGLRFLRTADNRSLAPKKNEVRTQADGEPRTANVSGERSTSWKVTEITDPSQCCSLRLPDNVTDTKVSRLIYTNSGSGVLALASNAEHKLWIWQISDANLAGKATATAYPVLWKPKSGIMMINKTSDTKPEEAIPCLALTKNDSYVVSASGGEISLFNMVTFKSMATCMSPPPAATFLAFHPSDYNIIAIGFEDSSIKIYKLNTEEVITKLDGHQNKITGLAFSLTLGILVSTAADSQLCIWSMAGWEKQSSTMVKPRGRLMSAASDTQVQFHQNQVHLLVISEKEIAIYDAQKLVWLDTWCHVFGGITAATYSADSQSIFVIMEDGTISVLTASNLRARCRINPAAYLPSNPVRPLVIASHPTESNQFAVGLSNGHVYVVELPPGST